MRARAFGVAAVIVGGFDDRDLRRLLGRDLGVAITGSEDLGFTLVLTEGFGHIRMADRTWKLLVDHAGHAASVSGATQIRAGVMRPEILIPLEGEHARAEETQAAGGIEIGTLLRNPDWVQLAEAFGAVGIATEGADDLVPALRDAFAADAPVVVSCPIPRLPNPF